MKTVDILKQKFIAEGRNHNQLTPAMENLCGIIDRQNRRIEALEKAVNKGIDE